MKLSHLYDLIVKYGIEEDPRGSKISEYFKDIRKAYRKAKGLEKTAFDKESLTNPFADTRILYGSPEIEVNKVLL